MNFEYLIYSLEDDKNISHVINLVLTKNGYEVKSFLDYRSFREAFLEKKPNMILLDLMLPEVSGEDILKEIRSDDSNDDIEIIIISAKNQTINKIDGLDLGADDYITKPFDVLELISRVNAHSRRSLKKFNDVIKVGDMILSLNKRELKVKDEIIKLTNSEYLIIEYLFKNKDKIVYRDELFELLWGKLDSYETRILDVHINQIRKKVGENNSKLIETIYGVGYRIKNE